MTLKKIALGTALVGGILLSGKSLANQSELERTRREVQLMIDADTNKVITRDEWTPVYNELGVEPKQMYAFSGYGFDLTTEQLKQYSNSRERGNQ